MKFGTRIRVGLQHTYSTLGIRCQHPVFGSFSFRLIIRHQHLLPTSIYLRPESPSQASPTYSDPDTDSASETDSDSDTAGQRLSMHPRRFRLGRPSCPADSVTPRRHCAAIVRPILFARAGRPALDRDFCRPLCRSAINNALTRGAPVGRFLKDAEKCGAPHFPGVENRRARSSGPAGWTKTIRLIWRPSRLPARREPGKSPFGARGSGSGPLGQVDVRYGPSRLSRLVTDH